MRVLLAKLNDVKFSYKLECDGKYHYFTGKKLKDIKIEKCWCKNKKEKNNGK